MANLTNGTSPLSSRDGTDSFVLSAKALAEFFTEHQSFLNVSRENTDIFILIVLVKNAIACYGISSIVPLPVTIRLLITLTCYGLVLLAGHCVFNFTMIWGSFAAFLCFQSRATRLPAIAQYLISITSLCVAPIYFRVPCTLDFIADIFLIVHVGCYTLKTFLGPVEDIIEQFFVEVTVIMIFLAGDLALDAKGLLFMMFVIFFVFFPLIFDAIMHGKVLVFFLMLFIQSYCVYEQTLIYRKRSADITRT